MRPIFTIHAGEYLVANFIEQNHNLFGCDLSVWIPSKDKGVDLLVVNSARNRTVGLQVKYSKGHSRKGIGFSFGWWSINERKLMNSSANYWVLVFPSYKGDFVLNDFNYCVISPKELYRRLKKIHHDAIPRKNGSDVIFDIYLALIGNRIVEVRELRDVQKDSSWIEDSDRDFTSFFNNWNPMLNDLKGNLKQRKSKKRTE